MKVAVLTALLAPSVHAFAPRAAFGALPMRPHAAISRHPLAAVSRQPVAVAIDAEHGGFRSYHRGVMGGKCGTKIDHSVLIVGFGTELVPPPPPPGPTVSCAAPTSFLGCFVVNRTALVLPKVAGRDHDRLTLENCAQQCQEMKLAVAGVDVRQ